MKIPGRSALVILLLSGLLAAVALALFLVFNAGERKMTGLAGLSGEAAVQPAAVSADEASFRVFQAQRLSLPEAPPEVSLLAVGDIMLSRTVAARIRERGDDHPFRAMSGSLRLADIVFANLETPLTGGREIKPGEMTFRADPALAAELRRAGFNVVSLANNHTPNFGERGLNDTLKHLDAAGIRHAGAGTGPAAAAPATVEAGGQNFEFLAYTDARWMPASYGAGESRAGVALMDVESMRRDVTQARNRGSIVVVSMHAGIEYAAGPDKVQTAFARAAVDAGADLVLGHHPHVVQTVEYYNGKFIFYSLGNFIFDQDWSRETRDGLAVKAVFRGRRLERIDLLPVVIDESQPRLAAGDDARRILARLKAETAPRQLLVSDGAGGFRAETLSSLAGDGPDGPARPWVSEAADLDRDSRIEAVVLRHGRLSVLEDDGPEVWRSPADWWVDGFSLADADGDGWTDINMSVWKVGSFGEDRPFWLEEPDHDLGNHLFVMDLEGGRVWPRWQSSALDRPNCESLFADLDQDDRYELVVLEGEYGDGAACRGRHLAVWKWQDWGFANVWRGPAGSYKGLDLAISPAGPAVSVEAAATE